MGSNTTAVYQVQISKKIEEDDKFEVRGQMLAKALPKEPTEFMRLYMKLGRLITVIKAGIALTMYRWKCHDGA